MKLTVHKNNLSKNVKIFLRSAGYTHIFDRKTGKESFAIRLSRDHYPRLHMYVLEASDTYTFNLHLDQKKPSYSGQRAHSAEYDSPSVAQEINRLKSVIHADLISQKPQEEKKEKTTFIKKIINLFRK